MKDNTKNTINIVAIIMGTITAIDYIYGMFYYKIFIHNNLNSMDISILMSVASLSILIFDFPSGNISDKIGRKKTTAIGVFLWGIGLCIFSISKSFYQFLLAIVIFNLGVALESGSLISWLHTYLTQKNSIDLWDKVISDISVCQNFVKFFLNGILLILISIIDFNIIFICGVTLILLAIFLFLWKKKDENCGTNLNIIDAIIDNFKVIFTNCFIRKLAIIKFLSIIFLSTFLLAYPYKFINKFNFSEELLPYLYFAFNFIMFLSSFLYRKFLINNFKINKIYKNNLILEIISIFFILFSNNLLIFFIGIFLFEVFFTINIITFGTIQYNYFPEDKKSSMVSALSSVGSLSSSLSFLIVGLFLDNEKYLIFLGIIIFICSMLSMFLMSKIENNK